MVRYRDGSVLAQLGNPDMRTPIAYCLGLPERISSGVAPLDFETLSALTFRRPDLHRFPCLRLAYEAMNAGGMAPCVLNAANETAVEAAKKIKTDYKDQAELQDSTNLIFKMESADQKQKTMQKLIKEYDTIL